MNEQQFDKFSYINALDGAEITAQVERGALSQQFGDVAPAVRFSPDVGGDDVAVIFVAGESCEDQPVNED